jgi:hypothetical protein
MAEAPLHCTTTTRERPVRSGASSTRTRCGMPLSVTTNWLPLSPYMKSPCGVVTCVGTVTRLVWVEKL